MAESPDSPEENATPAAAFAAVAVRLRLLTEQQVQQALGALQATAGSEAGPGRLFVEAGLLTAQQAEYVETVRHFRDERLADRKLGDLAVARGWATSGQINAALDAQKLLFVREKKQIPVGEMLVHQRVLTGAQRDQLLQLQHRARAGAGASAPASVRGFKASVSDDQLQAFLMPEQEGAVASVSDLGLLLKEFGVVHGIDQQALARLADGSVPPGEPVKVASGEPAVPGTDGRVDYLFEVQAAVGREVEDGSIDFRDRGEIPEVQSGTELARRVPPEPGRAGTDVYGRQLAVPRPKAARLKAGKGTREAEPGVLVATAAGHPRVSSTGVVSVFPEYRIDGDVAYNVGHVTFHGRVVVTGTIRRGFHVRCRELQANEIEETEIEVEGDINVTGGVIGADIRSGGQVRALYLHEARLECMGDVAIGKEVVDSTVITAGAFHGERCTVLTSSISAWQGIFARNVGSVASRACEMLIALRNPALEHAESMEQEAASREADLADAPAAVERLQERRSRIDIELAQLAQVQDRSEVRLRDLRASLEGAEEAEAEAKRSRLEKLEHDAHAAQTALDKLFSEQEQIAARMAALSGDGEDELREAIAALRSEAQQLKEWVEDNPANPELRVTGVLHADTLVRTPHNELRVKDDQESAWMKEVASRDEHERRIWPLVRPR